MPLYAGARFSLEPSPGSPNAPITIKPRRLPKKSGHYKTPPLPKKVLSRHLGPRDNSFMRKTIVIFSGGLDSTTLLYWCRNQGHHVRALSIDYGQRHVRELTAARRIAGLAGVEHRVVDLTHLRPLLAGSSQTDDIPVPDGHYADATMAQTVVPNRNAIMLAVAAAWAISTESNTVAYAAHAGDHPVYWDCRPDFVRAQQELYRLAKPSPISIWAPFLGLTKTMIVTRAVELHVPYEETYSCYRGDEIHCGSCGTCVERREAFQLAGVPDPTVYRVVPE